MRLIKRIKSLRLILNALLASLLPVSGALLILFLVMAVFAIIGANTWADSEPLFGSFSSALFTVSVINAVIAFSPRNLSVQYDLLWA